MKLELDIPEDMARELQRHAARAFVPLAAYALRQLHFHIYGHIHPEDRATDAEVAEFHAARKKSKRVPITAKQRNRIFERCEGRCAYCTGLIVYSEVFHIDHIVPLSKGGTNDESNLTLSCVKCNVTKHNKLVAA